MSIIKSSLAIKNISSSKESNKQSLVPQIQYKQINNHHDIIGELSDEQKQAQFNRNHEQYIKMKINRKKEILKLKKQQFGTSSSQSQQSSQQQIGGNKIESQVKQINTNNKIDNKNQSTYNIILILTKSKIQTDLIFHEKEFQINKKLINYIKITKIGILQEENIIKIVIYMHGEELCFLINQENYQKNIIYHVFLLFFRLKMGVQQKDMKKNIVKQQFSEQHKENAIIFDKIYKKSQIIGKWQQRYIIIKPEGIYSYRSLKSSSTMFIPSIQIKQLQTSFDSYKQSLVIKLFYDSTKTDFGLPYHSNLVWLQSFIKLIENK